MAICHAPLSVNLGATKSADWQAWALSKTAMKKQFKNSCMHGRDKFAEAAQKRQTKGMFKALALIFLAGVITTLLRKKRGVPPLVWYDRSMFKQFRHDMLKINPTYRDPTPEFSRKFLDLWMDSRMDVRQAEFRARASTIVYFESLGAKMPQWFRQHLHDTAGRLVSQNHIERQNMIPAMRSKKENEILNRFYQIMAGLRNKEYVIFSNAWEVKHKSSSLKYNHSGDAQDSWSLSKFLGGEAWRLSWREQGKLFNCAEKIMYIYQWRYYERTMGVAPTEPFFPYPGFAAAAGPEHNPWV